MRETLQYYWDIPAPVLDDARVAKVLQDCVGRPLFFADAVFTPLFAHVAASSALAEPVRAFSVDAVVQRLQGRYNTVTFLRTLAMRMGDQLSGTTGFGRGNR
jgi:hypothetical protein